MSNASAETIIQEHLDFVRRHRETYLTSDGLEGHIMDMTNLGGHAFTTNLLLRCKGRKSGRTYITPLIYGDIGGEVVIIASLGGADHHPSWYLNVKDSETIDFQIGGQAFRATWREAEGPELEKIWKYMVDVYPPYDAYQASTRRKIPTVVMKPVEAIARFEEIDNGPGNPSG